jgi:hypothetical protein
MTSAAGRLYVVGLSLLVFFVAWATVAARPWAATAPDPRLEALRLREARIAREAAAADRLVAVRWAAYRAALAERQAIARAQPAPPPTPRVRIVTLPPLTATRTS